MKAVPGRKTDASDAEWIADLLQHGLLKASFISDKARRELRELVGYGRVREGNANLSERLQEVKMENKALRGTAADFERVKRAIGPEQADRILEAAHQQEQAEKERKRAAKQKARLG